MSQSQSTCKFPWFSKKSPLCYLFLSIQDLIQVDSCLLHFNNLEQKSRPGPLPLHVFLVFHDIHIFEKLVSCL